MSVIHVFLMRKDYKSVFFYLCMEGVVKKRKRKCSIRVYESDYEAIREISRRYGVRYSGILEMLLKKWQESNVDIRWIPATREEKYIIMIVDKDTCEVIRETARNNDMTIPMFIRKLLKIYRGDAQRDI